MRALAKLLIALAACGLAAPTDVVAQEADSAAVDAVAADVAATDTADVAAQAADSTVADPAGMDGPYTYVGSVNRGDLRSVTSVVVSPDGEHLYAAAWVPATISRYECDPLTGSLDHQQSMIDPDVFGGAVALRLSPDGRYAASTAFQSKAVVLFKRDPDSGVLERLDIARNGEEGVRGLNWVVDAAFSPDARFLYVIDSKGSGMSAGSGGGAVTTFRITEDEELEWVATSEGVNDCFAGARGTTMGPGGDRLYVAASGAGALTVLDRDAASGALDVLQVIRDGEGIAGGLAGAMGVDVSPDGRHVYVVSGRFEGDNAVSVFESQPDGKLALVQELISGEETAGSEGDEILVGPDGRNAEGMRGFDGGNEILVSPDGRYVFAAGTKSGTVVGFERDPDTGRLTYLQTLDTATGGAAGLGISPDGNALYVAAENGGGIAIYSYQY